MSATPPSSGRDSSLSRAAVLAARTFTSSEVAAEAVLDLLLGLLGMRSVFLTELDTVRGVVRVVAARNTDPEFSLPVGLEIPLELTH